MAATRLIPLHENKGKTVSKCLKDRADYVKNSQKTEDGEYVSAYECNPEIVDQEFYSSRSEYLKDHREARGDVIAYQIRQAFKPGEITPEEANEIGYELAMKFTKGKHAFLVATHTDKAHIHNHILFNSTNLNCDGKFKNFFLSAFAIQRISDQLCLEHGLSVIKPKPYSEQNKRMKYSQKESWRSQIQNKMDAALLQKPKDFEEFLSLLEKDGVEVRRSKTAAIRLSGQKRYVRFRSLGVGYSAADIKKRISGEMKMIAPQPKRHEKKVDMLIDIQEKLAQGKGAGYERWAKVYNVKQMAKVLLFLKEHDIRDLKTLTEEAENASKRFSDLTSKIKNAEKRMEEIQTLKNHIFNYSKTKDVYVNYRKQGYSKKFFEEHRNEIMLHKAAKDAFTELGMEKLPTIKELNEEYGQLLEEKKLAYKDYKEAKQEMSELVTAKYDVERFLNHEETDSKKRELDIDGKGR